MNRPLVAVVLAGGAGTRLYPASRQDRPKQFLCLDGDRSLLERTLDRVTFADHRYVLTREEYADRVRERAPDVGILTEPAARDTGPALVYAAHRVREQRGEVTLLCLPSDQRIDGSFEPVARRAARAAETAGRLVTIGIDPDRPATGYGYIRPERSESGVGGVRPVDEFVEKPTESKAEEFVAAGWYWNSGIFAWTPETLLEVAAESELAPLVEALNAWNPADGFDDVQAVSIDTAILETTDRSSVVPGEFEWADLGSWESVWEILDASDDGTVTLETATQSTGTVAAHDTENCVLATDGRLSVYGAEDLVVASYDGHTVVVPRGRGDYVQEFLG